MNYLSPLLHLLHHMYHQYQTATRRAITSPREAWTRINPWCSCLWDQLKTGNEWSCRPYLLTVQKTLRSIIINKLIHIHLLLHELLWGDVAVRLATTHIWECHIDSNWCTSYIGENLTHMTYTRLWQGTMATFHKACTRPKSLCYT
jgi:hypothetical protein